MANCSRLILTRDGERAFGRFADGISRGLDGCRQQNESRKRISQEKAGVDQAVVSRALDGTRNCSTVAALFGAAGYSLEVVAKPMHSASPNRNSHRPQTDLIRVDVRRNGPPASGATLIDHHDTTNRGSAEIKSVEIKSVNA